MKAERFDAPWSRLLKITTFGASAICLSISLIGLLVFPPNHPLARASMIALPLLTLAGCSLFMIRGYTLAGSELTIHRLGWCSKVDLGSLSAAEHDPQAFSGSIRLAGNGGLFAFCGWFRNQKLGVYRAFATDLDRAVVLRLPSPVVVTPGSPEKFVEKLVPALLNGRA